MDGIAESHLILDLEGAEADHLAYAFYACLIGLHATLRFLCKSLINPDAGTGDRQYGSYVYNGFYNVFHRDSHLNVISLSYPIMRRSAEK